MTLIDGLMPEHRLLQVHHVAVTADPATTWRTIRAFDLYRIGWVRALFRLRTVPERLAARVRGEKSGAEPTARIEDITGATGFHILGEAPGREVVVGSVGKFWQTKIDFARVTPEGFTQFAEPGYGKLSWSLRVDPRPEGGSWITFELRVGTTDASSWPAFARYWRIVGRFSHAIRTAILHAYARELGAAAGLEKSRALAGDDLLPTADQQRTHTITIEAPPARLWPWLVQMGCQRAGFYSLDRLDNGGVPSAERIIPELQRIAVGDVIPARPTGTDGFLVLDVAPERHLVLGSPELRADAPPTLRAPYLMTWAFVLEPIGDSATRLSVRVRGAYKQDQPIRARVAGAVGLGLHEVMERAQLRGLKRRAESAAANG